MTKARSKPSAPGTDVFHRHREEYQRYLHLTEAVQSELLGDVEELRAQEGWDEETSSGVQDWIEDKDSIWRLLRVSGRSRLFSVVGGLRTDGASGIATTRRKHMLHS
jgi:hypothetical protein